MGRASSAVCLWFDNPVFARDTGPRARAACAAVGPVQSEAVDADFDFIFFDRRGEEIMRVDSVVHCYRLHNFFDYIHRGAYHDGKSFRQWRRGLLRGGRRRGH